MFTREEKSALLEAIRYKIQQTYKTLEKTTNEEIKIKKQKRIEVFLSCKQKIIRLKNLK